MDNSDDPWNFHTCKLCTYRTRYLSRILSHVRQHRARAETHRFICDLHTPEEHKCEKCQFQSPIKVLLTKHFNTVHLAKETEHYLNSELKNCEKCDFQTYSSLVLLRHNCVNCCGNGDKSGNHILQVSRSGNGQREKICTISSTSVPNDINSDDDMVHKPILRSSKRLQLSNVEHTQHPSNNKTCTICSHGNPNDVDSDDMPTDHMKHKRILRNPTKPKPSNIQQTQLGNLKSFECDLCPYKTVKKEYLRKHVLRKHNPSKNNNWFTCEDCPCKYKNKSSLRRHVLRKHLMQVKKQKGKQIVKRFKCADCSYNTVSQAYLREHICRRHTPSEQINWCICEYCSHKAKIRYDLDRHILAQHTQFVEPEKLKRLKTCDQCSYKALKKGDLKNHIFRKHTP